MKPYEDAFAVFKIDQSNKITCMLYFIIIIIILFIQFCDIITFNNVPYGVTPGFILSTDKSTINISFKTEYTLRIVQVLIYLLPKHFIKVFDFPTFCFWLSGLMKFIPYTRRAQLIRLFRIISIPS